MQSIKFIFLAIFIFVAGCAHLNEEQNIEVEKRINQEANYEEVKTVTNTKDVQKVREIVEDIDWEKAVVSMVRPADYTFAFQYVDPEIEAKAVLYELWISPDKDKVELVIDAESKYVQLGSNQSKELFDILTGEELSDQSIPNLK